MSKSSLAISVTQLVNSPKMLPTVNHKINLLLKTKHYNITEELFCKLYQAIFTLLGLVTFI